MLVTHAHKYPDYLTSIIKNIFEKEESFYLVFLYFMLFIGVGKANPEKLISIFINSYVPKFSSCLNDTAYFNLEIHQLETELKNMGTIFKYVFKNISIKLFLDLCNTGYFIILEICTFPSIKKIV